MQTGIHLEGTQPDPSAIDAVANAVDKVFKSGSENHMDQETVRAALTLLGTVGTVHQASINNTTVDGGRSVHVHVDADTFGGTED